MTRRDWWLGIALIVLAVVIGFAIQTTILLNEIRALQTPGFRKLASLGGS